MSKTSDNVSFVNSENSEFVKQKNLPKICCIFDSKGEHFGQMPFTVPNTAEAIRDFQRAVNDPKTTIGQYPGDFTLFQIGEWDQFTGTIYLYEAKINLGVGSYFLNSK